MQQWRAKALDCLERSVRSGFDDWDRIRMEPDFNAIREEPRFKKMLERGKRQPGKGFHSVNYGLRWRA